MLQNIFNFQGESVSNVDLKILLPDKSTIIANVRKNSRTPDVFRVAMDIIAMSPETSQYFALFEIVEYGFERKLRSDEFPHNLYIQNYSTASCTCLTIRKWIFSIRNEIQISNDIPLAEKFFFWQVSSLFINPLHHH